MGRFYKTAQPQFVEDFVYTPPYEMLMKLAETKQQALDTTLAQAKLFDNFNIQHLKSEDDIYNVKELQRYYGDAANNIAEAIRKDKGNAQAYMPQLEALQKELQKDFTTGNISKIQGSAAALAQWEKDNEARKKDSPGRYQAARNHYLQNWLNGGGNSLSKQWSGEQVTKDLDWDKIYDAASKIKASEYEQAGASANGGYLYKNKISNEVLSEKDLMNNILARVLTPENRSSLIQTQQYGLGSYFNPNTGEVDLNQTGWNPVKLFASSTAYSKHKEDRDMSSDGTAMTYFKESQANQRQQAGFAHAKEMEIFKSDLEQAKEARAAGDKTNDRIFNLRKEIAGETDPEIAAQKRELLNEMNASQFLLTVPKKNKYKNITDLSKAAGKGDQDAYNISWKSIDFARQNIKMTPLEKELATVLDRDMYSGNSSKTILNFIKSKGLDKATEEQKNLAKRAPNLYRVWDGTKYIQTTPEANNEIENFKKLKSFANNYIAKREEYLKNHSNTASSPTVGETLNFSGKQAGTKLYQDNRTGFTVIDAKTGKKLDVNPVDLEVTSGLSGTSYGASAFSGVYKYKNKDNSEVKNAIVIPNATNPVLQQATKGILLQSLSKDGAIYNELASSRVNELKQIESGAKTANKNSNEFVYRTQDSKGYEKRYNISFNNGTYNIVDNNNRVRGSVSSLQELAFVIDKDTNTK